MAMLVTVSRPATRSWGHALQARQLFVLNPTLAPLMSAIPVQGFAFLNPPRPSPAPRKNLVLPVLFAVRRVPACRRMPAQIPMAAR